MNGGDNWILKLIVVSILSAALGVIGSTVLHGIANRQLEIVAEKLDDLEHQFEATMGQIISDHQRFNTEITNLRGLHQQRQ